MVFVSRDIRAQAAISNPHSFFLSISLSLSRSLFLSLSLSLPLSLFLYLSDCVPLFLSRSLFLAPFITAFFYLSLFCILHTVRASTSGTSTQAIQMPADSEHPQHSIRCIMHYAYTHHVYTYVHVYIYIYMYIYICIYIYIYTCIYTCDIYIYVYMCVIYIYMYLKCDIGVYIKCVTHIFITRMVCRIVDHTLKVHQLFDYIDYKKYEYVTYDS